MFYGLMTDRYRRYYYKNPSPVVVDLANFSSDIYCVADAAFNTRVGVPASTKIWHVGGPLIEVSVILVASLGALLAVEGSQDASFASPINQLVVNVGAGGTFSWPALLVAAFGAGVDTLRSSTPYWRVKFTNGGTAQAALQLNVAGGGW
jgi:hypothetical protein